MISLVIFFGVVTTGILLDMPIEATYTEKSVRDVPPIHL